LGAKHSMCWRLPFMSNVSTFNVGQVIRASEGHFANDHIATVCKEFEAYKAAHTYPKARAG
jgi:hypothetical protein